MPTQHLQLPDAHEAMPRTHFGQLDTTHPPPALDVAPLLDVLLPLDELGATHEPLTQDPPEMVQSVHDPPPVPQVESVLVIWHMPVASQQPVQFVESHVAPPLLLLVLVPLELVELPPSSPLPLLLVLVDVFPDELL